MQNIEAKFELRDLRLARAIARALGAIFVERVEQTDTYFRVTSGRLKKREAPGEDAEFVFYLRDNESRSRLSRFRIFSEQEARDRFGEGPLPVWVVVRKTREVFMLENIRIHLDQVEGLGLFIEFEALVTQRNGVACCHESLRDLRDAFNPVLGEPLGVSYSDLAAAQGERSA